MFYKKMFDIANRHKAWKALYGVNKSFFVCIGLEEGEVRAIPAEANRGPFYTTQFGY